MASPTILALALASLMPSEAQIRDVVPVSGGGGCIMFNNGVCICSNYGVQTLRDLNCAETANAQERICSYNVQFRDETGIGGDHAQQRMDVFAMENGAWKFVRAYQEPVKIDIFAE